MNSDVKATILRGVFEQNIEIALPRRHTRRAPARPVGPLQVIGAERGHAGFMGLLGLLLALLLPAGFGPGAVTGAGLAAPGADLPALATQAPDTPVDARTIPWMRAHHWASAPPRDQLALLPGMAPTPDSYNVLLGNGALPIAGLFGLKVHTIVIDPGHGGNDPGAIGPTGLREKDITLDVARRLAQKLSLLSSYRVLLTRKDDRWMSLRARVAFAREHDADLFISIHVNSIPQKSINLVETYYFGPQADRQTLELADAENQDSGYAVGDFHHIIQKIGNTLKTQESRTLAAAIQSAVVSNINRGNRHILDAGIKTAPFVVLLGADVPSVLVEISCISNPREDRRLADPRYRGRIASYLQQGIDAYLAGKSTELLTAQGEKVHEREKD